MKNGYGAVSAVLLSLCICGCLLLAGCGPGKEAAVTVSDRAVSHEEEFGGVYIDLAIDDFNALGFAYGDSVDISFSNGYTLTDVPYYNGYYTQIGEPLLVAYPGYPYIKACVNSGGDLWETADLRDSDTAEISLHERGKYLDIQSARDISYQDDRSQFASDAVFANFRSVNVGGLKENVLYRSASPCDNQHNRAPYVDALIAEAGVNCIVNLSDTEEKLQKYINEDGFASPYFLSLYEEEKVIPLGLNMNFSSEDFRSRLVSGLIAMSEQEGPYLVHCTEGKDRTGFVCMLLEALCGAGYQEIVADYMITYDNYYGITASDDPDRYEVIVETLLLPMLKSVAGDDGVDPTAADLSAYAERYLLDNGMNNEQLAALISKLRR